MSKLRAVSQAPVVHEGQGGTQHAYDALHPIRTEFAVGAAHRFLVVVYSGYLRQRR